MDKVTEVESNIGEYLANISNTDSENDNVDDKYTETNKNDLSRCNIC